MKKGALHCPTCGAAARTPDARRCAYCGTGLAGVQCGACFGMLFVSSRFCPHCGAAAANKRSVAAARLCCPRCGGKERRPLMETSLLNRAQLAECPECCGIWIGHPAFRLICTRADVQADTLKMLGVAKGSTERTVRYLRCPECNEQMGRRNYARRSGVILDFCNSHGLWFDRDELRKVIEFIRSGGLKESAYVDAERLLAERERKAQELRTLERSREERDFIASSSAASLIAFLLRRLRDHLRR